MGFLVAGALLLTLGGCASDGRELADPPPGATAPPIATTTTAGAVVAPGVTAGGAPLDLRSPAFEDGASIPVEHTCDGEGVSPPLLWSGVPAGAVELAIAMIDADGAFVHWVAAGLDPALTALAADGLPEQVVQATNTGGTIGWVGPCPPPGDAPHHYTFTLYALDRASGIADGTIGPDAVDILDANAIQLASFTGIYERRE